MKLVNNWNNHNAPSLSDLAVESALVIGDPMTRESS